MNTFEKRRWLIIPVSLIESIDFNEVLESSANNLRLSIDGTKTFVKYEINEVLTDQTYKRIDIDTQEEITYTVKAGVYGRPSIYNEQYPEYTHSQILAILETEEWKAQNIPTN